ncbi:MFS transporter [Ornithinimicrobium sp. F0845]|uniref:MFS transporter n=1 Tax=Ornithinimicrobium sp. F0845 TaxID=2926412 RepID=UPI001FF3B336|nr:MFS transporter [Ornithinimicrobium sp. F0845]MCK0111278.1 MFS transporter [Ornithinimicrobium sp. F0845]
MTVPVPTTTARSTHERSAAVLAVALLLVELVAACQSYLTATITPLMAQDLDAREGYGLLVAVTQAAMFLTMPLGAALLSRWPAARMLAWLTPVVVLGGAISAVAPDFTIFLAGRVLAALAAGALMTVSLSALATALPPAWRRMTLAGYALVWLVASLVGPVYAGWASAVIGWRWALVAYLPLFLAARAVVILRLREMDRAEQGDRERLALVPAALLAAGITAVSLAGTTWGRNLVAGVGVVVVLAAATRILPTGTLTLARGRRRLILLIGVLCGAYFGAHAVVAITAHDLLGRDAGSLAVLLGAGGVGWAVLGMICGRWPARTTGGYVNRVTLGALVLAGGTALMAAAVLPGVPGAWTLLVAGWTLSGVGMGLCYVDTLNRGLDTPVVPDGIGTSQAAQALVMAEVIATALAGTLTASALAWIMAAPADRAVYAAAVYGILGLVSLTLVPLARRT